MPKTAKKVTINALKSLKRYKLPETPRDSTILLTESDIKSLHDRAIKKARAASIAITVCFLNSAFNFDAFSLAFDKYCLGMFKFP